MGDNDKKLQSHMYCDFSKEFDMVPHQRLLGKIKAHGIVGKVQSWISAWLSYKELSSR